MAYFLDGVLEEGVGPLGEGGVFARLAGLLEYPDVHGVEDLEEDVRDGDVVLYSGRDERDLVD